MSCNLTHGPGDGTGGTRLAASACIVLGLGPVVGGRETEEHPHAAVRGSDGGFVIVGAGKGRHQGCHGHVPMEVAGIEPAS